jgi:hypothetical protein
MSAGNATSGVRFRVFVISMLAAISCALVVMPAVADAAPPVANDVFAGTNDVTPVPVNFNATDPDLDAITFSIVDPPSGGTLGSINQTPPGSVVYTANPTFAGTDSFTYRATAGGEDSDAIATITVRPQTAIDGGPSGLTNDNTPTFSFSSPQAGTIFECRIDSAPYAPCTSAFTATTLSDGAHTFNVRARAGLGGPLDSTPSSRSFTVDATAPNVVLEQFSGQDDPTRNAPVMFALSINEDLNPATVSSSDFDVANGTIASISGGPEDFEINVTPTADGPVTIAPSPSFSVEDVAGNAVTNPGGSDRTVTYDTTPANVVLEQANLQADPTNVAAAEFSFTSNEPLQVASVEVSDFSATNGVVTSVNGSGSSFTVTVTAAADGPVSVAPSGTFSVLDVATNETTTAAGADRTVTYDSTPAIVDLEQDLGQVDPSPVATVQFRLGANENLRPASVTASDFNVTNGTITGVTGSGDSYTIAVTGTSQGVISIAPSGSFSVADIAGNDSTTAGGADRSVTFDLPPVVSLAQAPGQNDPSNVAAINFRLSSDKNLNPATVTASDFDVTNGLITSVTGGLDTYTVEVTAAADGAVTIAPSGTFEVRSDPSDFAQSAINGSDRSVTYDSTAPVSSIDSSPSDPSFDRTPSFAFSANEAVSGFECSLVADADPSSFSACSSPFDSSLLAPGDYRFEVRSTDIAGNAGAASSYIWTIEPSPIVASAQVNPYYTRGGAPVTITVDASDANPGTLSYSFVSSTEGGTLGSFTAGPTSGSADYTAANGFAGTDTVTVRVRNTTTDAFTDVEFDVVVRPKTVLLTGPGVGVTSAFTPDNTPTFTFDAVSGPGDISVPAALYSCSLDGSPLPSIECAGGTFTPAAPLSDGTYTFEVTAAKPAINQDNIPQSVSFTVDTVNPEPPVIVTGTEGLTNNNDLSYSVEIPEGTAECRLSRTGGPVVGWEDCDDGNDAFVVSYPDVADGEYLFEIRTIDRATNLSTIVSRSTTVDTVVNVSITAAPADGNTDARPSVSFSSPENPNVTYTCRSFPASTAPVDRPDFAACSSPEVLPFLDQNVRYRFEVKGVDPAGNETVASTEWDQANTAPVVPAPDVIVEAGQDVVLDLGSTDADSDPLSLSITGPVTGGTLGTINQTTGDVTFSAANDAAGVYTFTFQADDDREAGVTGGTATVRVQPQTAIDTRPPAETNDTTPTWAFSSPSGVTTFECNLDGAGWVACDGGSYTPDTPLAEGPHTLEVRAVSDTLKDPTPPSDSTIVDTTAPVATIDTQPVALSNDATPAFTFSSADASAVFECSVDGGDFAACSSPFESPALTDGLHDFAVRAIDPATNVGIEDNYSWEVDLTLPEISLGGTPPDVTNGPGEGKQTNARRPLWYFERSDLNLVSSQVRCRIDAQAWLETCLSPFQPPVNLSDGLHTLHIEADDGAGNTGALAVNFRVNTLSASVAIDEAPASPSGPSAQFTFSASTDLGPEGFFQCRTSFNGGPASAWATCASPLSLTGLSSGTRKLDIRAVDSAGNASTGSGIASHTWTTIGGAPDTTITGSTKNGGSAAFAFSSPGNPLATFQCSIDNGAFTACTSPKSYSGLAVGSRNFRVRAINAVGTVDATPAQDTWTVTAATAPNTSITKQPPARTSSNEASFEFVSSVAIATFECRIDGEAWSACTSPVSLTGLAEGEHTFEVRSTSTDSLTDQSPAQVTWTVGPPDIDPVPAELAPPSISAPKSVKAGRSMTVKVSVTNVGGLEANPQVCLSAPRSSARVSGSRCRTVEVAAGATVTTTFRVKTKRKKAGKQIKLTATATYVAGDGTSKKEFKGHVTLLK